MFQMKITEPILLMICLTLIPVSGLRAYAQESFHPLRNTYMGLTGESEPQIFLPGKISTGYNEGCSVFYRQGLSFLWRTNRNGQYALYLLEDRDGRWQPPTEVRFFEDDSLVWDFSIAPGGARLYFTSDKRPSPGGSNIWSIRLIGDRWQEPEILGPEVNSDFNDGYPSLTTKGDLYFFRRNRVHTDECDLYVAQKGPGGLQKARRLGEPVNSSSLDYDPFVAPNGSYLIFASRRNGGHGAGDLYISFKNPSGGWCTPVNLGSKINSYGEENRPSVTLDGRFFFYTSDRKNEPKLPPGVPPAQSMPGNGSRDIYWMNADFINVLRERSGVD